MKIRIESDGTPSGTKVFDAETGRQIDGVTRIEFEPIDVMNNAQLKAKLTVYPERVDIICEAPAIERKRTVESLNRAVRVLDDLVDALNNRLPKP